MATEKHLDLISRDDLIKAAEAKKFAIADNTHPYEAMRIQGKYFREVVDNVPTVNAVVLPYHPRPLLKDRNPHNTDVYCPECGTNLSGYYGDEPLPIVTCFNCGEILDPCKATTGTDGERKYNG